MPKSSAIEAKIEELVSKDIADAGYELVRVHIGGNGKYAALQIMAERADGKGMTVEDCAKISRAVSAKLEGDKELADKFDLEVSSPGIDRPLVKLGDYARFQGLVAKVELEAPMEGQRKFQGRIVRVAGEAVELETDKGLARVPFQAIAKAKLVLTDELLKAAASGVLRSS